MLVIRRIHVRYALKASSEHEQAIGRAFDAHMEKCPVYRSLCEGIDITTELTVEREE